MAQTMAEERRAGPASQMTAQLRAELQRSRAEMERWAARKVERMAEFQADYERVVEECAAAAVELQNGEKEVRAKQAWSEEVYRGQEEHMKGLGAQVEELKVQQNKTLPEQLAAVEARRDELAQMLLRTQQQAASRRHLKEEELGNLTKGVLFYSQLGLEFERVEEVEDGGEAPEGEGVTRLRLSFSQISRADPTRIFSFTVAIDGNDQYDIRHCSPPIPEAALGDMLAPLNQTNDFSGFVRGMRRAFVELAERDG